MRLIYAKFDIDNIEVVVAEWYRAPLEIIDGFSKLFWMWVRIQLAPESCFSFFPELVGICGC